MKEIMKKIEEQNLVSGDYVVIVKLIQACQQRGAIRPNEMTAVGKVYDKLQFILQKIANEQKEKPDGGLSKTDN